jgi:hypothetical protein
LTVRLAEVASFAFAASVAVMLKVYEPAVEVADVVVAVDVVCAGGWLPPPPPHPVMPTAASSSRATTAEVHRGRRSGRPKRSRAARSDPPLPKRQRFSRAEAEEEVVFTETTAVWVAPGERLMLAGVMLHVGRFCAPVGEAVNAQARFMVPE